MHALYRRNVHERIKSSKISGELQFHKALQLTQKASTIKKAIKGFIASTIKAIGKTLVATIITSPITYLAVKEAYETRGYFAVGGEWLLMIGLVVLILCMMDSKLAVTRGK